jgi:tetratricopeptide (TPR) repeat protein
LPVIFSFFKKISKMARFTFFIALLVSFFACQKNSTSTASAVATLEIPRLLDRAEDLRNGKEWDDVQNFYGTQVAALRANPNDYEARLKLAECFIQEARVTGEHPHYYPAALRMVEGVVGPLENRPDATIKEKDFYFQALSHKASVQLSLHDFVAARATAQKATTLNPHNAYIVGCLVDANVELGQYAEAVQLCDRMVGIRPDLRSYARVSYLREIYGDHNGAIEAMKMAVGAGYPGYEQTEWARLQLGGLYERYGTLAEAEAQYRTSLEVRPNYPFAMAALAGLEHKKGNLDAALKGYEQAANIIPEIGFYIAMAEIQQQKGNQAEFEKLIPEIETMFAEDMAAGHNMSLEAAEFQLQLRNNPTKALELARSEYECRPDNRDVNALMAQILRKMNDPAAAAEHEKKAKRTLAAL